MSDETEGTIPVEPIAFCPLAGYEGVYEISRSGVIRRVGKAPVHGKGRGGGARIGRIRSTKPGWSGYPCVQLWKDGINRMFLLHRLVAATFLGPCPPGHEVNHIDGNKANPDASNLEYVTRSQNLRHAYEVGLMPRPHLAFRKLTADQVRRIRLELSQGFTHRFLAAKYGVEKTTITSISRGITYKEIH